MSRVPSAAMTYNIYIILQIDYSQFSIFRENRWNRALITKPAISVLNVPGREGGGGGGGEGEELECSP